ncbi:hypothetical protein [Nonomuraea lactucae]|uniref:hypothetical protein n=1 Tax=Nonomuraea lactucae TaxID=2249762 RepID=UPI000DE2CE3D|nr:hypothetical protein [Nonomuraea lactucae]
MTWRYKNRNTGQVVELDERDACLDILPNWTVTGSGAPQQPDPMPPPTLIRPPETAPKAAWVGYAISRGMTEADAKALSKASLIEEFGADTDDQQEEGDGDGQG